MDLRKGFKQAKKREEMKSFWEGKTGAVSGMGLHAMKQKGYTWEKGGIGDGQGRWGIGHFEEQWTPAPSPPAFIALTVTMMASVLPPIFVPPPPTMILKKPKLCKQWGRIYPIELPNRYFQYLQMQMPKKNFFCVFLVKFLFLVRVLKS